MHKVVLFSGAAFFAASAFAQTPTSEVNVGTGAQQGGNFNLQLLEEVDALRREITELRENIDQQRFEMERLRRENAQSIENMRSQVGTGSGAPAGGGFDAAPGEGSTVSIGGGAADPAGSTMAVGAGSPDAGGIDAGTEEILSNLYDGQQPAGGVPPSAPPAAVDTTGASAAVPANPEEAAAFRAEQARFRAEQAELLEAQAQFLQEQARFRQEQARFLEEQAGAAGAGAATSPAAGGGGGAPVQQGAPVQAMPDTPGQGAVVPTIEEPAADTGPTIDMGVPGADASGQPDTAVPNLPEPVPSGEAFPSGTAPAGPSLEMVIIENEPASVAAATEQPQTVGGYQVTSPQEVVNPFEFDAAINPDTDASVAGGLYSSALVVAEPGPSPVMQSAREEIYDDSIPQGQPSDSATTIAPDAMGSEAPVLAEEAFGRPPSGTAFGPELVQASRRSPGEQSFAYGSGSGSTDDMNLTAEAVRITPPPPSRARDAEAMFDQQSRVMANDDQDFVLAEVTYNDYSSIESGPTTLSVSDAPPEPVPEPAMEVESAPQVVNLESPSSLPPPPVQQETAPPVQQEPDIPEPEPVEVVDVSEATRDPAAQPEVIMLDAPSEPAQVTVASAAPPAQARQESSAATPAANSEEAQMYNEAYALYQNRKFSRAIKEFRKQLDRFPNGQFAADAHYWSGEALYVTRSMPAAEQHMETILLEYSDSARAPDAMLTLAAIRKGLGRTDDASRIYRQVIDRYPGTPAALDAQSSLASLR